MFVTAAGELADVAFGTGVEVPALSDVLSMTQWKTAHYSFQAPLRAGAILAGSNEETAAALAEYGRHIGIAFQLRDDILGVFGSEYLTGKSATSDVREGKMTALMCYGLQQDESGDLRRILTRGAVDQCDVRRVRQLLESTGARQFIENLIGDYARLATAAIGSSAVPEHLRRHLDEVAHRARKRIS
jgi:geranylgeranyl diphosphate synthase type II